MKWYADGRREQAALLFGVPRPLGSGRATAPALAMCRRQLGARAREIILADADTYGRQRGYATFQAGHTGDASDFETAIATLKTMAESPTKGPSMVIEHAHPPSRSTGVGRMRAISSSSGFLFQWLPDWRHAGNIFTGPPAFFFKAVTMTTMHPKTAPVILALIIALGLGGTTLYVWKPWIREPQAPTIENVKVGQVGEFFIYMPLYYAIDRGFFKNQGLAVDIVNTGGDEKSVAAVISGDVTFGVGDPTFSPIAGSRGAETRVIAGVVNGVPFWGVTFRTDIPAITDPKQLKGYMVATFPAPSTAYTLQSQMFREGGLEPNIRQAQFGSLLPAIQSGAADIALELEPNVSLAVKEGGRVVYSLASRYGNFAITGVTVSDRTITQNPDLVRKFVTGLDAAERYAHDHPDDIEEYAMKRFPNLDPGVARSAIQRMLKDNVFPPSATISPDAWRQAVSLRVQAGELSSVADASKYLDMSFLPRL
jgi:NitT/TauT family transport system substrate-binding protein